MQNQICLIFIYTNLIFYPMKNLLGIFAAIVIMASFTFSVSAQTSATIAATTAGAKLIVPMTITQDAPLHFGVINNLAGALLGFLEGSLFLGLIIFVASRYAIIGNFFGDQLSTSIISPLLLKIVNLILPILPEALKALKSII